MNGNSSQSLSYPEHSRHLTPHALLKRNVETLDSRPMTDSIRSSLTECETKHFGRGRSDQWDGDDSPEKKEYHPNKISAGKPTVRKAHGEPWKDVGESKCRAVMARIGVYDPVPKGSPIPTGKPSRDSLKNRSHEGRRKKARRACAPSSLRWESIDWDRVNREVLRLQMRIAKAVREKRWGKVKALQHLLVKSRAAKLWAVRRVTTNRGKRTPGIDGVIWKTARQKSAAVESLKRRGYRAQPLRRLYIPKKGTHRRRPLGIPCMKDRAMQALYLLALNPIAETRADPNSYGFRLRRCVADAWGQCYIALAKSYAPEWIFEADIEACFDQISHDWLLENIPMDRKILRQWLSSGYLEDATFHRTLSGTPQGGIISPVIANMALDGLEAAARSVGRMEGNLRPKIHVVRYADDFVITAKSRELLEGKVIPVVKAFLAERGLTLSARKSKITHIREGFDFLGAEIKKHGDKLLMRPRRENVQAFIRGLKEFLKERRGTSTWRVIQELNRRIQGWVNFYRCLVSSKMFRKVDHQLFGALWRWIRFRHQSKRSKWLKRRYFRRIDGRDWTFSALKPYRQGGQQSLFPQMQGRLVTLMRAREVPIRRHIKVRAAANPFDPEHNAYFQARRRAPRTPILGGAMA